MSVSPLAVGGLRRMIEHSIDLAGQDEIILVQSFDLLRAEGDCRVAPAEADVRVMTLGLGKLTDLLNKGECFAKIAKSKGALDAMGIIAQLPTQGL